MTKEKPKVHPLLRAWAAGMFDGKIVISKTGGNMFMDSHDLPLLKRVRELIGVGEVTDITKQSMTHGSKGRFRWQTSTLDDCREAILFVAPFLSPQKTKVCADKLAMIERNKYWRKRHPEKAAKLDAEKSSAPSADEPTTP